MIEKELQVMPSTFAEVKLTAEEIHRLIQSYRQEQQAADNVVAIGSIEYAQRRVEYFERALTTLWGAE